MNGTREPSNWLRGWSKSWRWESARVCNNASMQSSMEWKKAGSRMCIRACEEEHLREEQALLRPTVVSVLIGFPFSLSFFFVVVFPCSHALHFVFFSSTLSLFFFLSSLSLLLESVARHLLLRFSDVDALVNYLFTPEGEQEKQKIESEQMKEEEEEAMRQKALSAASVVASDGSSQTEERKASSKQEEGADRERGSASLSSSSSSSSSSFSLLAPPRSPSPAPSPSSSAAHLPASPSPHTALPSRPKPRYRKILIQLQRLFAQLQVLDQRDVSTRALTDRFAWFVASPWTLFSRLSLLLSSSLFSSRLDQMKKRKEDRLEGLFPCHHSRYSFREYWINQMSLQERSQTDQHWSLTLSVSALSFLLFSLLLITLLSLSQPKRWVHNEATCLSFP